MKHRCALALLFVFVSASAAFAADPLKVHEAGFGPEIRGLRLGNPMTWPEMINTQANISRIKVPGVGLGPIGVFSLIIADNYKAVDFQSDSPSKPGKWIVVNFLDGKNVTIMNGGGGMLSKVPKSGTLGDFFALMKKNGLNYASTPSITLRDERIIQYSMGRKDLPTETSTTGDFAQWLSQTYNLGVMEQKNKNYEASNPTEGWRVVVTDSEVMVFSMPIPDSPKK
jgi:hypothetical protein